MRLLANYFAIGGLAGGAIAALLSCFVFRDATAPLAFVLAGYSVAACISAALYALVVRILGGRQDAWAADDKRAFYIGALCIGGEYFAAMFAHTHQYDRILLFSVPACAGLVEAVRLRTRGKTALKDQPEMIADL